MHVQQLRHEYGRLVRVSHGAAKRFEVARPGRLLFRRVCRRVDHTKKSLMLRLARRVGFYWDDRRLWRVDRTNPAGDSQSE